MDLQAAEARAAARTVLRRAYRADVDALASSLAERVRAGEFDASYFNFHLVLAGEVARHSRVADESLRFETIAFSENRNAIEQDFIEGLSVELHGPWAKFEVPLEAYTGEPCDVTLPAWQAIAYHAFSRDVEEGLVAILGESPEEYIATRLGHPRPGS